MKRNFIDDAELKDLSVDCKGVIVDMMQLPTSLIQDRKTIVKLREVDVGLVVPNLNVEKGLIESWGLDLLVIEAEKQFQVLLYIFFDSEVGKAGRAFITPELFQRFHEQVKLGYYAQPYHNYTHACDVCYTVFRLLGITQSYRWLNDAEHLAILIAALCHDLGHFGMTNLFLIDTGHEVALRYNDKSPLENMHCANLFAICQLEERNIFEKLDYDDYKSARRICIDSILHTDNSKHFEIVNELAKMYEMSQNSCDKQAHFVALGTDELFDEYKEVLLKEPVMWMELFLHLADISNSLKPFQICEAWAHRVLDEFFAQGDEEKRLQIPVGLLNDRDKINRPGSQHGFINFLVAPLVFGTVSMFPMLHCLSCSMADNMQAWRDLWVEDADPLQSDVDKRDADVKKIREQAQEQIRGMTHI